MNRALKFALIVGGTAALTWCAGWIVFASMIPMQVDDTTTKTDAIVVLTGGSGRIEAGLALLQSGFSKKLFVSGAGGRTQVDDLVPGASPVATELATAIALGREAEDTPGNAVETAAWAQREGVTSIRLVTAAYHMRRSMLEMSTAMPTLVIIPNPVFPSAVKADWWRWPGTASLIAREYTKFMLSWLRIALSDVPTVQAKP